MIANKLNKLLPFLFLVIFFCNANVHANENIPYRAAHNEICYEIKGFKIECGNFKLASTILTKKYRMVSAGEDVMASFSAKTHPGDHPILNRLAKKFGYIDTNPKSLITNKSIFSWNDLGSDAKSEIVEKYSKIVNAPEMKRYLANYLNSCINYWSNSKAEYDERIELPTLAEVSALCIVNSEVLP